MVVAGVFLLLCLVVGFSCLALNCWLGGISYWFADCVVLFDISCFGCCYAGGFVGWLWVWGG